MIKGMKKIQYKDHDIHGIEIEFDSQEERDLFYITYYRGCKTLLSSEHNKRIDRDINYRACKKNRKDVIERYRRKKEKPVEFKGKPILDSGYVYAPYVPMTTTVPKTVVNPLTSHDIDTSGVTIVDPIPVFPPITISSGMKGKTNPFTVSKIYPMNGDEIEVRRYYKDDNNYSEQQLDSGMERVKYSDKEDIIHYLDNEASIGK